MAIRPSFPRQPRRRPTVRILRVQDLLGVELELVNLALRTPPGESRRIERVKDGEPAYLIVHFPPQNIAEEAFFEYAPETTFQSATPGDADSTRTGDDLLPTHPARTRIGGASRLVFRVPDDVSSIPYTLPDILAAMSLYEPSVSPLALPPPPSRIFREAFLFQSQGAISLAVDTKYHELIGAAHERRVAVRSTAVRLALPALTGRAVADVAGIADIIDRLSRRLRTPRSTETAIELPYRLILSPHRHVRWAHAKQALPGLPDATAEPVRHELWHTRLGIPRTVDTAEGKKEILDEGPNRLRALRAIWTRDPNFKPSDAYAQPDHFPQSPSADPFRMSLDSADRHSIVHLTSNYFLSTDTGVYLPRPVDCDRLMLSTLGAWIDSRGAWSPPKLGERALSVEEWRQIGTQGRDHFVRVVYKGFLFPFGHRASLIKITERKFHPGQPGNPAFLRQRMFIVVREPEKLFTRKDLVNAQGHRYDLQFPFRRVRITTLVTPSLNPPEQSQEEGKSQALFWPRVGNSDFQFHLVAEGLDGKEIGLNAPLLFADNTVAHQAGLMQKVADTYQGSGAAYVARRRRGLNGQPVVFAETSRTGDTTLEAQSLFFGAEIPASALGLDQPRFYPAVREAEVRIPSVQHLTKSGLATKVAFHGNYLQKEFGTGNSGEVFLKVVESPTGMDFGQQGDRSGGFMQPSFEISGLSKKLGPVGGNPDVLGSGKFEPADVFAALKAKLFGVIDLKDVILPVANLANLDLVPKFVTDSLATVQTMLRDLGKLETLVQQAGGLQLDIGQLIAALGAVVANPFDQQAAGVLKTRLNQFKTDLATLSAALDAAANVPTHVRKQLENMIARFEKDLGNVDKVLELLFDDEITIRFDWKPNLGQWPGSGKPLFIPSKPLLVAVELKAKKNLSSEPTVEALCRLEDFKVDLIAPVASFLVLDFEKIEFFAGSKRKADVNVVLRDVEFTGVLSFVETLRTLIPLDGFSDPPAISVSEKGVDASFSIALPSVAVGVFSLQNMSLGAGFTIPFIGEPLSVRFNFCDRQQPFTLTVSMFGGGGFFGLTLDPGGVQVLEAAFEFGASLSVDFGVASGGIHAMAGIYFRMEVDEASLTGYLRMGGVVDVLGLISASIELYMELNYEFSSGKCVGRATLTIEIEILLFSASVEISAERKFAGSNGDPTFAQLMEPYQEDDTTVFPWREYCQAFA